MKLDSPEWLEVARALKDFAPTGDANKDGFRVARICQGVLGRHGQDPSLITGIAAGKRLAKILRESTEHNTQGIPEAVQACWGSIVVPEGWNALEWAVRRAQWLKKPEKCPGRYVTPYQHAIATTIWHTFKALPVVKREVFASMQDLAKLLLVDRRVISATLALMIEADAIRCKYKGNGLKCSRYQLPPYVHEEHEDLEELEVRGNTQAVATDLDALFGP